MSIKYEVCHRQSTFGLIQQEGAGRCENCLDVTGSFEARYPTLKKAIEWHKKHQESAKKNFHKQENGG